MVAWQSYCSGINAGYLRKINTNNSSNSNSHAVANQQLNCCQKSVCRRNCFKQPQQATCVICKHATRPWAPGAAFSPTAALCPYLLQPSTSYCCLMFPALIPTTEQTHRTAFLWSSLCTPQPLSTTHCLFWCPTANPSCRMHTDRSTKAAAPADFVLQPNSVYGSKAFWLRRAASLRRVLEG